MFLQFFYLVIYLKISMNMRKICFRIVPVMISVGRGQQISRQYGNGRQNAKRLSCIKSNSKKEVFQPHLPVRLPCYDLAPVIRFALGRSSRWRTSGTPNFHGLTGGVYKARERIHRTVADVRLLANPTSRSRVADSDPNWDGFSRLASCRQGAALCSHHCNTCVAPDVRAVLIWRHPPLPLTLRRQSR